MSVSSQNRVLILYADTGSGHRSVARALRDALRTLADPGESLVARRSVGLVEPDVSTVPVRLRNPVERHAMGYLFDLYGPVTRRAPWLYSGAYRLSNGPRVCDVATRMTSRLLYNTFSGIIADARPDLVVSVHSLLTQPMMHALRRANHDIPLFSVVTDLISVHQSWIVPEVDRCFVPTAEVRDELISRGMRDEQLSLSGLPIHPSFSVGPNLLDRETLRRRLGLDPGRFTVLIMGGGEGIGGLASIADGLARSNLPVQIIAVTGHNDKLRAQLLEQQDAWPIPYRTFGFVGDVPNLMRAADVVVTKAGSVTIAESLASGLPIIISCVVDGQESGNVDFVMRHRVGIRARTTSDVLEGVRSLQRLPADEMRDLQARARALSAPDASIAVASQILSALHPTDAPNLNLRRAAVEPLFA